MHGEYHQQSSLKDKLKSSICCFTGTVYVHHEPLDNGNLYYSKLYDAKTPRTPTSPASSSCLKKPGPGELGRDSSRVRSRSLISRMGRKHHRQSQSADFSYDASSYALNFEDESRADDEEFPFRNFTSRLPASPPKWSSPEYKEEPGVTVTKEIVGYS